MTSLGASHVDVSPSDPVYVKIKQDLAGADLTITRLVRITNVILKEKFEHESGHLQKIKQQQQGFSLNIKDLYHGTTAPFDQICEEGLDERLSRSGRFGRGIYFSDNPRKCCKYAEYHTNQPYLLRCKVILGDVKEFPPTEQDPSLVREPLMTCKDGKRVYYDSVKGQPSDYTEYVIYDKRRALIEYIAFYVLPPPSAGKIPKPAKVKTKAPAETVRQNPSSVKHTESASSMSSFAVSEYSDNDVESSLRRSRSSTPRSGSSSPISGRSSPVDWDGSSPGDVNHICPLPAYTDTCSVPRFTARNRTRQPATATGAASSTSAAAGAASSASSLSNTSSCAPAVVGMGGPPPDAFSAPQYAALRQLIDMKGKIPEKQLEMLTREYHRTYGVHGSLAGYSSPISDDPISEVMKKLIQEFKDVTQCTDTDTCRRYIELGNMDLNRAIEAYIDGTS